MEARRVAAIRNAEGLHVNPATQIAHLANRFSCTISLRIGDATVDAKSALEILTIAPRGVKGARVEVEATGDRADEAARAVAELIESGFGETVE